jgi:outer membrane protein OmpA-like peptidoglycan-associated protein
MGAMFANGGPRSTAGSLLCKHGVNLKMERQDDCNKMQEALVTFATELSHGDPNPAKGAHFVAIMGDGSATFLKGVNDVLKRLGPEYTAKVIGSCGYSRGEDKFMGPADWKLSPSASRGGVVAGVLRDGDWNIAQKWLGDNGLRNNPDEKTWDPDALNWVAASDYIDAAQKYVAGYSEERPVVRNGKRTGETKRVTVNGVVTWTPGDVIAAQQRGGIVSIVSTREYTSQMPNVIIGIDKWMRNNRDTVEGMLQGITEGGDLVKSNPEALHRAAAISQEIYHEQGADAAYWERYYKGVQEKDKQGSIVELGGSSVNNLADNLLLFGLVPGSSNLFAATYKVFGDIVVAQYPELVPSYAPVSDILDTSYLQNIAKRVGNTAEMVASVRPNYNSKKQVTTVVSRKSWHIQFATGQASFTAYAQQDLQRLLRDLLVASGTVIEIHGHTDSAGNPAANKALSEARAFAVRNWLMHQSSVNFPESRFRIHAHGQDNPVAPNATQAGRAQNRRVDIVLGTTSGAGN